MRLLSLLCAITFLLPANALTIEDVIVALEAQPCHRANVTYEVWMPSAADPVQYSISILESIAGDSLSPCDYLISWELPRGQKLSKGFSSYSNGNHFRYRDARMQEYHYQENALPFSTEGGGVQRNAQFVDLLPAYLAEQLKVMTTDTTFVSEFDEKNATLSGVRRINGYDAQEYSYQFDKETGMPLQIDFVYNPASISEQLVTAKYTWLPAENCPTINETYLTSVFPTEFEKFRISNFRVENLTGSPIPAFSYDQQTGQRITHSRGEVDLAQPVLIVFADASSNSLQPTLNVVREAGSSLPVTILYAFANNDIPEGFTPLEQEYILNGPQSFIVKTGVTLFPTFLLVNSDGTVNNVILGMSQDLDTTLAQSLILLN